MAQAFPSTYRVLGFSEFVRATAAMPAEIRKDVREALRTAGERVQRSSAEKTAARLKSGKSAAGYRVIVRARGVSVDQSLRKTTGLRPDWGRSQMRDSLVPSLLENEQFTEEDFRKAIDEVNDFFELRARWIKAGFLKA